MGRAFEVRKVAMAKTAATKSKLYAKFGREIYLAAKSGTPDPDTNQTLKRMIEKAKREQVPADVIKRNIDKAKGGGEDNLSSIRYEGFGPGNSMLIVECLTDNVNRTISEDEVLEILVLNDLDVSDIETDEEGVTIYSDATNFSAIRIAFNEARPELDYDTEQIMWLPIMETTLTDQDDQDKFERLMNMLDELDDVQDVYHNVRNIRGGQNGLI